ncbi:hypothetical protein BN7_3627 [Wickerhamomyces ciferrii]|uniref:Protein kinase domain-containing protein n=1 Tax=Wickerhamomyces ciferrii (strain ATCC 14091 / BCRC 22168 / CBS 111 / JCM 3599 / NBRC 0793 / NRRL Y-1031 F-60-10) TaxID=1206466 RepID=K0KRU2_WICCF|nr:uncharacterized protein BN7_3627 [Wickerhamomyces ciferrii]CCH44068.1 hypothetical protein BN7_3627 [Wickerhamomyces ciferrii]
MSEAYEIYKEGGLLGDRYQKLEDISEGAFGLVSLAKDIKKSKLVAVKYIFKEEDVNNKEENPSRRSTFTNRNGQSLKSKMVSKKLTQGICEEAIYEISIQEKIGFHPYIISLLDYFDSFIILEYCARGDLYEAIKADAGPTSTPDIVNVVLQLIEAVQFVHSKGVYHRDIKPENILISDDWSIRLTDFGLASTTRYCNDFGVGSERYMAPELFDQKNIEVYDALKVDIWSIGICFLNIVFHKNPFGSATHNDKSFSHFARNREALFDVFSTMSIDFFTALRYSLTLDPENRDLDQLKSEVEGIRSLTIDDDLMSFSEEVSNNKNFLGTEPIKIKNNAVGRKALGIPTPSTYINNHFQNYKTERFNRKDFFTPPTVSAHYLEKYEKYRKTGNGYNHNHKYDGLKNRAHDNYHLIPPPSTPGQQRRSRKSSSSSTGKYVPPSLRSPKIFKSPLQSSAVIDNNDIDDDLFVLEEADSPDTSFQEDDQFGGIDDAIASMDLNDKNYSSDSSSAPSLLSPMPIYNDRNKGSSSTIHNRRSSIEHRGGSGSGSDIRKHQFTKSADSALVSEDKENQGPGYVNGPKKYVPPHHRADYPQWRSTHKKADSFHHHNNNGRRFNFNNMKNGIMSSSVPTNSKNDWFAQASKMELYDEDVIDDDFEKSEAYTRYAGRVAERTYNVSSSSSSSSSHYYSKLEKNKNVRESTREIPATVVAE